MGLTQNKALIKQTRRKEVLRIFREKPHVRASDIAKTLNVKTKVISNDIRELTEELRIENPQAWHMHRERMLLNLSRMMNSCEKKFNKCRGATSGSRWVEEWAKLFEKEAKIVGVYAAEKTVHAHINVADILSKEQRDASIRALISGQEKGIIDITPNGTAKTE
jgi:hypothetical protein